jgi:hypothetical protein
LTAQPYRLVDGSPDIRSYLFLAAGGIFAIIMALAKGELVRAFKSVSTGLLGPLGTLFGLLVVFSVVKVLGDIDRARVAVNREASAIRMMILLAGSFPGEPETRFATCSAAMLTKPLWLSGLRWRNNRLP